MTNCACPEPGYCPRYKRRMLGRQYQVCSEKCPPAGPACPPPETCAALRATWEAEANGQPPPVFLEPLPVNAPTVPIPATFSTAQPQPPPEPPGLGDLVEKALSKVGITKDRVEAFVGAPCGCQERQDKLNRLGRWASKVLGGITSKAKDALDAVLSNQPEPPEPEPDLPPLTGPVTFGICLGVYGWPKLVEVQIRLTRDMNPGVPILIADDCTPGADGEQIQALEEKYPNVTVWSNPQRIGHWGGDLSVFWKAAQWGKVNGLRVVAKVSQRLLIQHRGWVSAWAERIINEGYALCAQRCIDSGVNLYVRTEACLLDSERWVRPAVLDLLTPRPLNGVTELLINDVVTRQWGGKFLPLDFLPVNRYAPPAPGIVWHCDGGGVEPYRAVAKRYGLDLDTGFSVDGRQKDAGYVQG